MTAMRPSPIHITTELASAYPVRGSEAKNTALIAARPADPANCWIVLTMPDAALRVLSAHTPESWLERDH